VDTPAPASYVLMARATDPRGETQPFVEDWNPSGYLWNLVPRVRVEAGAAPKVRTSCLSCHDADIIVGQYPVGA